MLIITLKVLNGEYTSEARIYQEGSGKLLPLPGFNKIGGVVQVECGQAGGELFLRVVDTGVGIPPERLEEVWSGLAKLNTNGNGRSSSMGLALSRFIILAHGGRVDAQSKYGAGSVFTLYLPLFFED